MCSPLPARIEMGRAGPKGDKDMTEEDDIQYYRRMFRNSLWWSVALVAMFALIAWLM